MKELDKYIEPTLTALISVITSYSSYKRAKREGLSEASLMLAVTFLSSYLTYKKFSELNIGFKTAKAKKQLGNIKFKGEV